MRDIIWFQTLDKSFIQILEGSNNWTLRNTTINGVLGRFLSIVRYILTSITGIAPKPFQSGTSNTVMLYFCNKTSWLIVSKAFEKSRKTQILSINIINAIWVERSFLNPNWLSWMILNFLKIKKARVHYFLKDLRQNTEQWHRLIMTE